MPTADATLLPPPFASSLLDSDDDECPATVRSLHEVGVETVLGAMIEHRRASQPSFASIVVPCDAGPADEAEETERAPTTSEVFLKAR